MHIFKKIIATLFILIVIILIALFAIYHFYFKPTVETVPLTQNVQINESAFINKFLPKDIDLSFTQISATSNTVFTEKELTDLAIVTINEMPKVKEHINGVKVDINGKYVDIYLSAKKYDIPFEVKLVFEPLAENGKGIFHYISGNLGFFNISKDLIFNNVSDTSVVQFDKANSNIILSFKSIDALKIEQFSTSDDSLKIVFKATLNFWDWLKQ